MTLADTCAPFVAVPIAWALLRLKRMLPGTPDRRYECMLAFPVPDMEQDCGPPARLPSPAFPEARFQVSETLWLPIPGPEHEHYTH